MLRLSEYRVRPRLGRILGRVGGALLFTIALCQSDLTYAGPLLGMYPIETAIVNACHSGQGGTGISRS
jgi:2-hydroxycarboxylate transporter family